ncbi:MAG: TetR/AcrR family transcriptional regulator [Bacteroidota bacterium]
MSSTSPKYQLLLKTGKQLFWKHGISRVTVTEICRESKVSKMTFYRMFDSKVDLAKKALEADTKEAMQKFRDIMNQDIPFKEKIKQSAILKFEGTKDIKQELIMDIYKNPELGLQPYLEELSKKALAEIMGFYIQAQKDGEIRKDVNPAFILYFQNKMSEMLVDPALDGVYETPNDRIMELFNFFFYGLFPRE